MQCSCWEVQYLSSPSNALYSCSRFPLLPLTKTARNSLISVFRQRKFTLSILLILKCSTRGEGEKPLWTFWCYEKVRDSHHWLQIVVFKPLFSSMQHFRRREGVLVSEEVWAEMVSSMLGLTWKVGGLKQHRDEVPALLELPFDSKTFPFSCFSNSHQCCAAFHRQLTRCI